MQTQTSSPASVCWHQMEIDAVARKLASDAAAGLSESEASRRLQQFGSNEIVARGARGPWRIFLSQLSELMVLILIAAALISALLGDYKDAIAIAVIVVLNATLGFVQEYRAEKAVFALKKLAAPSIRVRRDGDVGEIPSAELVPGDLILLEAGNLVAADCRIVESANLQTQEASLTGESLPVHKTSSPLAEPDVALGERRNMVFLGTFVSAGRGLALVTATGMSTQLGRIAGMIHSVEREATPLQRRLRQLGKVLVAAALFVVMLIFVLGWLRGEELELLFLTAVSLGVAAIPEGLPAVVTIALTLGAQRMLRRKALIRKLSAVETLGSVTVICSDKTGTLTENRMAAAVVQLPGRRIDLPPGTSGCREMVSADFARSGLGLLLTAGALCNDAIPSSTESASRLPLGDPTEAALLVAASRFRLEKSVLEKALPRVAEVPFSSERKRMTTMHALPADLSLIPAEVAVGVEASPPGFHPSFVAFTKGSVESVLERCGTIWIDGQPQVLHSERLAEVIARNEELATDGMRILGLAFRLLDSTSVKDGEAEVEKSLTFLGSVGLMDPARLEAGPAVTACRQAGIRPVMITGDHPLTADFIARQVGITHEPSVLTGGQLDRLSGEELGRAADATAVYARVSPEHKLRIVESLQDRGHIVAMTGDGVNDSPALKKADIGVAMGITGTDVAKEAADMVLLDDNFATIVAAVEEGRMIYDNIRKFIRYILTTNSGEIWVMLLAPFLGMPLPLLPLQILWMNLVTDGLPALALGVEPAETDTMRRPPRPPQEGVFARGIGRHVIWVGLLMGLSSLGVGYAYWQSNDPRWQTMVFTTLTLSQMAHVVAIRSERLSVFRIGIFSNRPLVGAVALTVILQLLLVYLPHLQSFFKTVSLTGFDLALTVAVPMVIFAAVELEKWFGRRVTPEKV
jgi:Ca2+-transporting ATPase